MIDVLYITPMYNNLNNGTIIDLKLKINKIYIWVKSNYFWYWIKASSQL